ncbi:jg7106 [Pararge aegeria aegeria]|uniref:Jg7106 protein n=1 Tax=Pararge aegeria aegeria TaxID=348720 RepID=A0A8S4QHV1_9NEOP|nr:jg7106 [Pararge aegeria aegeria]
MFFRACSRLHRIIRRCHVKKATNLLLGRVNLSEVLSGSDGVSVAEDDCDDAGSNIWCPGARYRPEPPEALARASHFTPHEIKLMYRGFKQVRARMRSVMSVLSAVEDFLVGRQS